MFPILAAEGDMSRETFRQILSGTASFFALILGFVFALQLVSYWITSKLLAGSDGSFGKGFMTLLGHTGIWIAGCVVSVIFLMYNATLVASFVALVSFLLNIWVAVKVHGFGAVRGFFYTIISTILSVVFLYAAMSMMDSKKTMSRLAAFAFGVKTEDLEKEEKERLAEKPEFATQKDAQAAAVKKFPELGVAGSPFNKAFLEKHAKLKSDGAPILSTPGWTMKLAEEVASEIAGGSPAK